MEILIISGLSGGGKSKAASFLEDMGFYIVDNMPAVMILKFAEFCAGGNARYDRVALVYDVRTSRSFTELFGVLDQLKKTDCLLPHAVSGGLAGDHHQTLQGDPAAPPAVLRHHHAGGRRALRERELMQPVKDRADFVIDTSHLSTAQLRGELLRLFDSKGAKGGMSVNVISFGYKYGLPMEADLVLDVRFMPNPYYIEALRHKTGLDQEVSDYVFSFQQTGDYLKKLEDLLAFTLPLYAEEGKTVLVIAVGCTGGHHRSVAIARALTAYIQTLDYQVTEIHRDMTRE
jgi:UPF0042 nucleotide-binding protein